LAAALACSACALPSIPSYCSTWNPMEIECPINEDPMAIWDNLFQSKIFGQSLAGRAIHKALSRNIQKHSNYSKENWNPYYVNMLSTFLVAYENPQALKARPLFMHFSGPTGVGKSLTADIVASSMFNRHNADNRLCGKFILQMRAYSSRNPFHLEKYEQDIRRKVGEQLSHCPRSVLIFDEIQSISEQLLDSIIEIFDGSGPPLFFHPHPAPVNTSLCVVIVISDIGSTKLNPYMDREQAKQAVQEDADKKFLLSKKRALLQNIVPFLPLTEEDFASVAVKELKRLGEKLAIEYKGSWIGKLTWAKEVPRWIAKHCWSDATCVSDGGRGVETHIDHDISTIIENALMSECQNPESVSFNNIDLSISSDGNSLVAKMDSVYSDSEFREL